MKIISTNIAQPTTFVWNGEEITTGIYKIPTEHPIYLGQSDVKGDEVSDRKVHGGEFKACYLFSTNQYPYWQDLYPNLDWTYGMLGENLTVENLDEKQLFIGDIYKLGNALVQITQPREPCFKFAHKFGSDTVLQQFITHGYSGTYVKVLKEGEVKIGDTFELLERGKDSISIFQLFELLYAENKNIAHINLLLDNDALPKRFRKRLTFFAR
ncbi:MOSC domain-containing protein [Winogradskyella thalassocola]|uniref:MOSC domain-containing protein YiiM n=1 Tax=Winogradskyella thalassocola TaxID=262004 RepID=A0A1G8H4N6_9FLAO|nr:MOSC domain-containing protein [Winogradskyella thalassocola]SDI01575.1 MOSC domain-containing protein YiiM [Winogradskyella thalassocola]